MFLLEQHCLDLIVPALMNFVTKKNRGL